MRNLHVIGIVATAVLISSCAAYLPLEPSPVEAPPEPAEIARPPEEPAPVVVHVVTPGQTLWRIARAYGLDLAQLVAANGIGDPTQVEVGTPLQSCKAFWKDKSTS